MMLKKFLISLQVSDFRKSVWSVPVAVLAQLENQSPRKRKVGKKNMTQLDNQTPRKRIVGIKNMTQLDNRTLEAARTTKCSCGFHSELPFL
jgi:hypothetical protein